MPRGPTDAEAVVVIVAVVVVCPVLWAAVEVEPDEQRLDLEKVELGLRALWETVATDVEEDTRIPKDPNSICK